MKHIAIFASGVGTNARNIIQYFKHHPEIAVECIVCNNPRAKVVEIARESRIPCILISKEDWLDNRKLLYVLNKHHVDMIVLAGFLWLIPENILNAFQKKIINIHPALLPKYGGANMYGMKVHEAVISNQEKVTGITIHFLNEKYDEGEIIFQKSIPIENSDTPETIAKKVHELEYEWYPKIIDQQLLNA